MNRPNRLARRTAAKNARRAKPLKVLVRDVPVPLGNTYLPPGVVTREFSNLRRFRSPAEQERRMAAAAQKRARRCASR